MELKKSIIKEKSEVDILNDKIEKQEQINNNFANSIINIKRALVDYKKYFNKLKQKIEALVSLND